MKKYILSILLLAGSLAASSAQDHRARIIENPSLAAANHYNYVYEQQEYTPAPKGYKPFYIWHYGRHGSRYMSSSVETDALRPVFEAAEAQGLLTEAGMMYWSDLKAVLDEQKGMVGMLTTLGAMEHRGIGQRMAERFPQVFKGRKQVHCVSSTSARCLLSMTNFTSALDNNTKGLDFTYVTGPKYYAYIAYHPEVEEGVILSGKMSMDFRRAKTRPEVLLGHLFSDLDKIWQMIGDPYVFENRLYRLSCMGHLSDHGKCLLDYFPQEALISNWEARNARFFVAYANSAELPHYASDVAGPMMKVMLADMDAALLPDSEVAADLSFGHDVTLMPLASHIGIKGMHEKYSFDQVNDNWNSSDYICMGANIQFVFYRNKAGEVLVKILYNEKETSIPALEASSGPYYRWADLRNYLVNLR